MPETTVGHQAADRLRWPDAGATFPVWLRCGAGLARR